MKKWHHGHSKGRKRSHRTILLRFLSLTIWRWRSYRQRRRDNNRILGRSKKLSQAITSVIIPAAIVLSPHLNMKRPSSFMSLYNSTQIGRGKATSTIAEAPLVKHLGRRFVSGVAEGSKQRKRRKGKWWDKDYRCIDPFRRKCNHVKEQKDSPFCYVIGHFFDHKSEKNILR